MCPLSAPATECQCWVGVSSGIGRDGTEIVLLSCWAP